MPFVSILIPSYNHAVFLQACLDSVMAQTFQDFEIIVVDDRSTDDSFQIAGSRLVGTSETVFQNPQNLGTYGTLARALELAKGELIAVLNSDDLWAPTKLEKQVSALDASPTAAVCVVQGQQVDENGVLGGTQTIDLKSCAPALLSQNDVLASGVVFRREGLRFCSQLKYSGDWVALLEQSYRGEIAVVDECLTYWRQHSTNTYRASSKQALEEIRVRAAIKENRDKWIGKYGDAARPMLGQNLAHLCALYIAFGQTKLARELTRRPDWSPAHQRRKLIAHLPSFIAHRLLWSNQAPYPDFAEPEPLILALDES